MNALERRTPSGWKAIAESRRADYPLGPPAKPRTGRPNHDHRRILDGILWRLKTGAPWRDLPDRYGPWQTVYHRFNALRQSGLLDRIVGRLQLRLDEAGLIDPDLFCIDGTTVRAARAAAGAAKKKPPGL